jgi:hypothetical protein
VKIVKTTALPARFVRSLGFGDISLRAWYPLRRALIRLLETQPVEAVLITGSPFYPMLFAPIIKRRFGIPVVLDFQDPWVSVWGAQQSPLSKIGISHRFATWLEPRAIQAADFITSVSEIQNAEMAARYEWLDRSRMAAIPIGGDQEDYDALRALPCISRKFYLTKGFINLSYVGTIWPSVIDTVRTLMRAAARLRAQMPALYEKIQLNFVGTTADPNDTSGYRVRQLGEAEHVADIVREVPQRLPYLEALSIQADSDGIIMLGSDERHYTASKVYSVLMSRRPFLSVFHRDSSAHAILSRAGGGIALGFSSRAELVQLEALVCDALVRLTTSPGTMGRVDPAAYAPYEARTIAFQYARIFNELHESRVRRH